MVRRIWWRGVCVFVLVLVFSAASTGVGKTAPGGTLVVTSYAPPWQDFLAREIISGFERETGVKVELAVGLPVDWIAKLRIAGKNNPLYDVIIATGPFISLLRKEGFLAKLPLEKVPNLNEVWPELRNKDDNGVISLVNPLGIAYRTDLVSNPPKRWLDLWRPEYKGKLGIYGINNSATIMFLMTLGRILAKDDTNMDVAFQKVKELLPVRLIDVSGTMEQLLTAGELQIGILDAGAVSRLKKQGVPLAWVFPLEGVFMFDHDINVTEFARNKELAFKFVNYFLSQSVQEKWAARFWYTPANRKVKITGQLALDIPIHTQVQIRSIHRGNWDWLNTGNNREKMIERWNREIVGR